MAGPASERGQDATLSLPQALVSVYWLHSKSAFPTPGDKGSSQVFMLPFAAEESRQIPAHLELFPVNKWAVVGLSNKGYNLYLSTKKIIHNLKVESYVLSGGKF